MSRSPRSAPPGRVHNDLEQLRRQAKELLRAFRAGEPDAVERVERCFPGADPAAFRLAQAQLALARSLGFTSWAHLAEQAEQPTVESLAAAVRAGDARAARRILRSRPGLVNVDLSPTDERRALHLAVLRRDAAMVRILMEAGADARKGVYPHRDATSAMTLAAERGCGEIVAVIEQEERLRREAMSCPNVTITPAQEELHALVARGELASAEAMLAEEPSLLGACDREGGTPLHAAASALREPLVAALLARRADPRRKDLRGRTPLDRAVEGVDWRRESSLERFPAVARLLLARGAALTLPAAVALGEADWLRRAHAADPESLRGWRMGPIDGGLLSVAVHHRRADMLRLLLELGLDPDERTRVDDLETEEFSRGMPLWHCAGSGRLDLAGILLEAGADPNALVYASGSPVFQAYGRRDEAMKALLERYGGRPDPATIGLYRAADAARRLLDGLLSQPPGGRPAEETVEELLWAAACGGDPEIVRMCLPLLDWPRDDRRWFRIMEQPLRIWNHGPGHWVRTGEGEMDRGTYPECLRLILEHGADPNAAGRLGATMLHRVAALGGAVMTEAERLAFARLLLDRGARLDARDDLLRSTPLGWACRWGRLELARLLIAAGADAEEPDAEPWARPRAWAAKMGHAALVEILGPPAEAAPSREENAAGRANA